MNYFGFHNECIERMACLCTWYIIPFVRFACANNQFTYREKMMAYGHGHNSIKFFNYHPLAALIEKKIIYMHGGIGRSIPSVEWIEKLERRDECRIYNFNGSSMVCSSSCPIFLFSTFFYCFISLMSYICIGLILLKMIV